MATPQTPLQEFIFEKMRLSHLAQVLVIENEAFAAPWHPDMFKLGIRLPRSNEHFYVARQRSKIIGYIVFQLLVPEGHIFNLAVASKYRRRGVAKYLLTSTLEFIAEKGGREVFLEVAVSNLPAQYLYRQFGFRIRGRRKNYYGHGKDAYIFGCHLQTDIET